MEEITVNGQAFRILRLLGKGKGGYSYLVCNARGEKFVVKQIHHEPCSYYTFGNKLESELTDYRRLQAVGIPMPRLLDADTEHERILKEYIDGPVISALVGTDEMKEDYLTQLEDMCRLLYPAGLNIDYYPTNFVVQAGRLYYIDYECNAYSEQWDFEHWGKKYWLEFPGQ